MDVWKLWNNITALINASTLPIVTSIKFCIRILGLNVFTYTKLHASPAHLYIPQLFAHCLPTIICVMLMNVMHMI